METGGANIMSGRSKIVLDSFLTPGYAPCTMERDIAPTLRNGDGRRGRGAVTNPTGRFEAERRVPRDSHRAFDDDGRRVCEGVAGLARGGCDSPPKN